MLSALLLVSLLPGAFVLGLVWRFQTLLYRRAPTTLAKLPATSWPRWLLVAAGGAAGGIALTLLATEPISRALLPLFLPTTVETGVSPAQLLTRVEQVGVGPLLEEIGKALPALVLLAMGRLHSQAEALSVGLLAGAGFSVVENLLVNLTTAARGTAVVEIVLVRLLFSPVMHVACTTAICLGLHLLSRANRLQQGPAASGLAALLLIGLGAGMHCLWNGTLLLLDETGWIALALGPLLLSIIAIVFLLTAMATALRAAVRAERS